MKIEKKQEGVKQRGRGRRGRSKREEAWGRMLTEQNGETHCKTEKEWHLCTPGEQWRA